MLICVLVLIMGVFVVLFNLSPIKFGGLFGLETILMNVACNLVRPLVIHPKKVEDMVWLGMYLRHY